MKPARLIRLANGSWIDPATVSSIRPMPTREAYGMLHRASVVVLHSNGLMDTIIVTDDLEAVSVADELASQVNLKSTP